MLGLVLCGGQSMRMGSDKGLLKLEAKTWAQTAIDKMQVLNIAVKLSVNTRQYHEYAKVFSPTDLIVDDDALSLGGPLKGVLSAHVQHPTADLFVLACDLPLMESFLLGELNHNYLKETNNEAYIFSTDGEPEPLCGIYTASGLAKILNMQEKGQLLKHSMKFMLDHLSVNTMPVSGDRLKYFRNFNAHSELNGM